MVPIVLLSAIWSWDFQISQFEPYILIFSPNLSQLVMSIMILDGFSHLPDMYHHFGDKINFFIKFPPPKSRACAANISKHLPLSIGLIRPENQNAG